MFCAIIRKLCDLNVPVFSSGKFVILISSIKKNVNGDLVQLNTVSNITEVHMLISLISEEIMVDFLEKEVNEYRNENKKNYVKSNK